MCESSGRLLTMPVGPRVTMPSASIAVPIAIESAVAPFVSNEKRKGAAMQRTPRPYSSRPCAKRGTDPRRISRRSVSSATTAILSRRPAGAGPPEGGVSAVAAWARLFPVSEPTAKTPQELSPRMFDNPVLELLSRVHPAVPPLLYLPVIAFLLGRALGPHDLGLVPVIGAFFGGLFFWSLAEYL